MKSYNRCSFNYLNSMDNSRCTIVDDNVRARQGKFENSWYTRNDSSNVSSLLHPFYDDTENDLNSAKNIPPKSLVVSNHCYKEEKAPRFCCDDCYCQNSPVYPKLPLKLINKKCDKLKGPRRKKFNHFCGCGCGFHSLRFRTDCCNKCCTSPFLRYSAHRDVYEKFFDTRKYKQNFFDNELPEKGTTSQNKAQTRGGEEPKNFTSKNVEEHSNKIENNRGAQDKEPYPILNLIENEQIEETCNVDTCNKITILDSGLNTDRDLRKLNTFRKENYFDCHSSGNCSDAEDCDHKCLHRFILDDRLIPRPLNADPYGTSRCVKCNRSSKSDILLNPLDNKVKQKPRLNALKRPKSHTDRLIPNQINFCNRNDGIEITVPLYCNKYNNIFDNHIKIKNPPTTNSLALRYQKGMI